jgi:hypothetical protein
VSGQLHAPATLPPGKKTRYPLERGLGGPQSRPGRRGGEKILDPTGTRPVTVAGRSKGVYCLRSLGSRDRVFEAHSGHGCLVFVYVCAFFCVCVQVEALR